MRVYELARELELTSKELLAVLKEMGIEVKSHASSVDEEQAILIRSKIKASPPEEELVRKEAADKVVSSADQTDDQGVDSGEEEVSKPSPQPEPVGSSEQLLVIKFPVTVRELADQIGQRPNILIKKLLEMGVFSSLNQFLDEETAIILGSEYGLDIKPYVSLRTDEESGPLADEEAAEPQIEVGKNMLPREPVVTLMGHIDHGKTSVLDAIRHSRITSGEAGGITQHIGAYRVDVGSKGIVFLDTPGHAAFTTMRSRGADLTDIVVVVIAADEGIMPQTVEAINHARAAGVPIIVAINKIDKSTARPDRVRRQLTEYDLVTEEMGGEVISAALSAVTKEGLDHLLEMILLQAEMMELKADPDGPASGVVVEAKLTADRGPVATILVKSGTLKIGDSLVCDIYPGKIKAMFNDQSRPEKTAGPSTPVEIMGLTGVPGAGSIFKVVDNEARAREIGERLQDKQQEKSWDDSRRLRLEDFFEQIASNEVNELPLILKGDVQGSVEAVSMSLKELASDRKEIALKIIHGAVGAITESDIMLAAASRAVIIGFQVPISGKIKRLAELEGVDIRSYRVIYEAVDDIRKALEGMLEPDQKEIILGEARVKELFKISKLGVIAGCVVESGTIKRSARIRVMRDDEEIIMDTVFTLKRFKEKVTEVTSGKECGIGLNNFHDFHEGDLLVSFEIEKIAQKL
jgi:translation initiation factor IF-2